jgi:hypothetical protein
VTLNSSDSVLAVQFVYDLFEAAQRSIDVVGPGVVAKHEVYNDVENLTLDLDMRSCVSTPFVCRTYLIYHASGKSNLANFGIIGHGGNLLIDRINMVDICCKPFYWIIL